MVQIWLSKLGKRGQLRTLLLSHTSANIVQIVRALEAGAPFLEALDISSNAADPETCRMLANYLGTATCLRKFNMSGCGITPLSQNHILSALLSNGNLPQLDLSNANNLMDEQSIGMLTSPFENIANGLHSLDLSRIKLSEASCLELFRCLANVRSLDTLELSDCFSNVSGHLSGMLVGHGLADTLVQCTSIKKLVLSAKKSLGMFTGPPSHVILPFIQRMQRNESLLQLDVSGNRIGDQIALALADLLRCNTTLLELNLDRNNVTLTGYQALEYGMHRNQTLQRFEYPVSDLYKGLRNLSSAKPKQRALLKILTNIQLAVHFNQANNGLHPRVAEEAVPEPFAGPLMRYQEQGDGPGAVPLQQQPVQQYHQPQQLQEQFFGGQQAAQAPYASTPALPPRMEAQHSGSWGPSAYADVAEPEPMMPTPMAPMQPAPMQAPMQPTPMQAPMQPVPMQPAAQEWGQPQPANDWGNTAAQQQQRQDFFGAAPADAWGQQAGQGQAGQGQAPGGDAGGGEWASKFGGAGGGGGEEVDRTSDLYLALASVLGGQQQ